jgi:predicted metal-dependent hydrolase
MALQFKVEQVQRGDAQYPEKTKECWRMDMHQLHLPVNQTLMKDATAWISDVLYGGKLNVHRQHWTDRLDSYLNKPSRKGDYLELLESEWKLLQKISEWFSRSKPTLEVVEVGWNRNDRICKVSIVAQLPETHRFLFLCVGADFGIKTFYVTPTFKFRTQYKVKNEGDDTTVSLVRTVDRSAPPSTATAAAATRPSPVARPPAIPKASPKKIRKYRTSDISNFLAKKMQGLNLDSEKHF